MRRYESYKDSGVEWLGEVPSHWNLIPNKYIFKLRKNVVGKRSNEYDLLSLSLKGVIKRDMENPEGKFPAEFDTYQEVKEGDFIFCLFDVEETPRTVGLSSYHGMITGAYTIFETNNVDKKFIYYFYLNLDSNKRLKPLYKGLRNTISKETFFSFNTFIPPLSEQQKISQFLDDKTAKIDQAVDLAEKQIALLKEHKQILIQNAVTQGLNPDVPLKDSGVEWIGQVPEHWESFRFKRVVEKVKDGTHGTHSRTEQGYPLLSAKNIFNNGIQITDNESLISEYDFKLITSNGFPRKNDLLVTCVGSIGRCCIYPFDEPIAFQRSVAFLRLNKKAFPGFYRYFIESNCYQEQLKTNTKLSIQGGVYLGTLIDLYVCFPPLSEQQTITIYLDTQTAKIDQAIALKTAHIEKLKEYKSVLINDVVTGKVRV
ncbi:restriction endonuclease subunit S [Neisseria sp. HMSC078C12]|uniref:restriction endonuclease subunit S n=1 Tax=Neisseria sp. HMSC078C12 TaxID=1715075 RepID=UPI0008AA1FB8|nr:restriction endonuclease subunit S [Neisseria sp. HMSC078C12]OHR10401.1 hypothetical protein HMPREF2596_00705 [Neisseria sp. HMSC078C12]